MTLNIFEKKGKKFTKLFDIIKDNKPDIICFQEYQDFDLTDYEKIYVEKSQLGYENLAMFVKNNMFTCIEKFVIETKNCETKRKAVLAKLIHQKSKRNIYVLNVHICGGSIDDPNILFYGNDEIKRIKKEVIDEALTFINDNETEDIIFILGDFNSDYSNSNLEFLKFIIEDKKKIKISNQYIIEYLENEKKFQRVELKDKNGKLCKTSFFNGVVDYIFYKNINKPLKSEIIETTSYMDSDNNTDQKENISDHNIVMSTFEI